MLIVLPKPYIACLLIQTIVPSWGIIIIIYHQPPCKNATHMLRSYPSPAHKHISPLLPVLITGHWEPLQRRLMNTQPPLHTARHARNQSKRMVDQGRLPFSFCHNQLLSCGTRSDPVWSCWGIKLNQALSVGSSTGIEKASKVCGMYLSGSAYVTGRPVLNA